MQNPFRNALTTFNLLPDALKDAFWDSFVVDISDLASNGNPLEHTAATTQEEAIDYVNCFDGVSVEQSRWHVKEKLTKLAEAFDLISPKFTAEPAPYSTMFGSGDEGEGLYIDFTNPEYERYFVMTVNPDEDDETVFTLSTSPVKIISETRINDEN
jgi:hypothetical protein